MACQTEKAITSFFFIHLIGYKRKGEKMSVRERNYRIEKHYFIGRIEYWWVEDKGTAVSRGAFNQ